MNDSPGSAQAEEGPREIERKYLVSAMPENLESFSHVEISQGYLAIDANGTEVRLRLKGAKCFQTVKSAGGLSRDEYEVELSRDQFDALWPATEDRRVEKTRYVIPDGKLTIELDVYKGQLAGLMTAEVEFSSESESCAYAPPPWMGADVTDDSRYKNKNLALRGAPN